MKTLERTFNQNKIRVVTISKEPWFVVADICKVLGLRKKDFDEGQVKALLALEAMEMLNLHYNPVEGFMECKESLKKTSIKVLEVKNKGILK